MFKLKYLNKSSFLSVIRNIRFFDLIKLIKSDFINLLYIFSKNRYLYYIQIFIDFKANGYAFIDKIFFLLLFSIFKLYFILFELFIEIKSYNNIRNKVIIYLTFFNFIINIQ